MGVVLLFPTVNPWVYSFLTLLFSEAASFHKTYITHRYFNMTDDKDSFSVDKAFVCLSASSHIRPWDAAAPVKTEKLE